MGAATPLGSAPAVAAGRVHTGKRAPPKPRYVTGTFRHKAVRVPTRCSTARFRQRRQRPPPRSRLFRAPTVALEWAKGGRLLECRSRCAGLVASVVVAGARACARGAMVAWPRLRSPSEVLGDRHLWGVCMISALA